MSKLLTDHHEDLTWTPSRIYEMQCRKLRKKPGSSTPWRILTFCLYLRQTPGTNLLHLSNVFDPWLSPRH